MVSRRDDALLARMDECCRDAADARTLQRTVLAEIRRVVEFDFYVWVLTDPATCVGVSPLAETPACRTCPG